MQRGIVFEIENRKATVMKNNGDFIRVIAHSDWKKGDVVTIKAKTIMYKPLATIAACFMLFISVSAFGFGVYFDETTLISLDINPSIELSANRFDRVIAVRSLNAEGDTIIQQVNVKNKPLDKAVSALFDGGLGDFIPQNPLVTFTVFSSDEQSERLILNKLQNTADTYVSSHHADAQIELLSVDEALINEAHKHNVTAGKYTALRELQEVLPEMEIESYSHHSISYIKEQTKIHGAGHGAPNTQNHNKAAPDGNKHRNKGGNKGSHH